MITIYEGEPGAGKSLFAAAAAVDAFLEGRQVWTNYPLQPGWETVLAARGWKKWLPVGSLLSAQRRFARLWHQVDGYDDLPWDTAPERSRLLILDEQQLEINSRSYREDSSRKARAWLDQHRKLGFDVILISHQDSKIDKQVRELAQACCYWSNLRYQKICLLFVSFQFPFPGRLFFHVTRNRKNRQVLDRAFDVFPGLASRIYRTDERFGDLRQLQRQQEQELVEAEHRLFPQWPVREAQRVVAQVIPIRRQNPRYRIEEVDVIEWLRGAERETAEVLSEEQAAGSAR